MRVLYVVKGGESGKASEPDEKHVEE